MEKLNIKQGDVFYKVFNESIIKYVYHSEYPDNFKYHIVINKETEEPERWHSDKLRITLEKDIPTYKAALEQVIVNVERKLKLFKEFYLEDPDWS